MPPPPTTMKTAREMRRFLHIVTEQKKRLGCRVVIRTRKTAKLAGLYYPKGAKKNPSTLKGQPYPTIVIYLHHPKHKTVEGIQSTLLHEFAHHWCAMDYRIPLKYRFGSHNRYFKERYRILLNAAEEKGYKVKKMVQKFNGAGEHGVVPDEPMEYLVTIGEEINVKGRFPGSKKQVTLKAAVLDVFGERANVLILTPGPLYKRIFSINRTNLVR